MRMLVDVVVPGDGVDHAADGRAAVKQRRGTLHNLQPLQAQRVDGFPVVSRLGRDAPRRHAVLHDEHTVPVEAANDGARGAGAETALGDARLVFEHLAERSLAPLRQLERVDRRDGLKRLERRLLVPARRHRHLLPQRGQPQFEIGGGHGARRDGDALALVRQVVHVREHGIRARRQRAEFVLPVVVRLHVAVELGNPHRRVMQRILGGRQSHGPAQHAGRLAQCRQRPRDSEGETQPDHFGGCSLVCSSGSGAGVSVSNFTEASALNFRYSRNSTSFFVSSLSARMRTSARSGSR